MNPILSVLARINGLKNDINRRYWEYSGYFNDCVIWEKTILFESFGGVNFQGNPYYLYKAVLADKVYTDYKLMIAHNNPAELKEYLIKRQFIDERVSIIRKGSAEYRNVLAHAKYLITNVSFNIDFIKKPEQIYLNTWHGTPLKYLGRKIQKDPFECNNAQRNFLMCDYLIAPNALTKNAFEDDYMVHGIMQGKIIMQGYPRNSIFFDSEEREKVKRKYHLDEVISVFYMPTWRGTSSAAEDVDQVSEIEQLAKELGSEYKVYVKFHPAMKKIGENFKYCYDMPEDIEVYEFLNSVDILITDYSSVFFDFANTGKQIILYQPDKEQYFKNRGVYAEVEQNLPFPIVYQYEKLRDAVKNNRKADYIKFTQRFCTYDAQNVSGEIIHMLLEQEPERVPAPSVNLYVIDFPVTEEWLFDVQKKLVGTNYRFVFVLKRSAGGFKNIGCWGQIDYCTLYMADNLTPVEKLDAALCCLFCKWFKSKRASVKLRYYCTREQRRLWGNMNIGHIYAKSKHIPVAVRYMAEKWPDNLQ